MPLPRVLALAALAATLIGAGCLNPLSMRRAKTIAPGQVEVIVAPEIAGAGGDIANFVGQQGLGANIFWPAVTGSIRFGVIDRLDLQLKVDPLIFPEISVGYQLIGEQPGDVALTVTGGIKPIVSAAGGAVGGFVHAPIGVLVDVPLDDQSAIYAGLRATPTILFGVGAGSGGFATTFTPGASVGLSLQVGGLVIQPEVAFDYGITAFDSAGLTNVGTPTLFQYAVAIGFGGRFGGPAAPPAPAPAPSP